MKWWKIAALYSQCYRMTNDFSIEIVPFEGVALKEYEVDGRALKPGDKIVTDHLGILYWSVGFKTNSLIRAQGKRYLSSQFDLLVALELAHKFLVKNS
jgi:hypothetical protein